MAGVRRAKYVEGTLACGTGGAGAGDFDTLLVQVEFDEVGHDGCVSNRSEEGKRGGRKSTGTERE
jgi:hypothetical protein